MPFCTNCGNEVGPADRFCARCGAKQSAGSTAAPASDPFQKVSTRTASVLCYVPLFGWLASIVVLASPRFQRDRIARFHAFQGLYLFVAWLLVKMVAAPLFYFGDDSHVGKLITVLMHMAVFGAWIFMLIKTSQEQFFALPIIGELAERSLAEQR